ncbi:hypothetical protein [Chryseobacterium populi]|uniref:Potassium transporter KefB n=1 Tax=Chryseobacterium populi TaxID=1144316 RepID=J3CM14_9FLAO|nr:hypothetical protein [Chryseobacterium populi]EJL74251.1 hypothetical protein PMI13_00984 [Chryseobacterium populi]
MILEINIKSLIRKAVFGALIGLAIISFFVFTTDHPKPEWGKFWMIRPLIITPLAGAFGGFILYSPELLNLRSKWKKAGITVLTIIGFIISLWLGIVLGLDGTLWN